MRFHRLLPSLLSLVALPACAVATAGTTASSDDFEVPRCAAVDTSAPIQEATPVQALDRPGDVVLFQEGLMEKPRRLSGPVPRYTKGAIQQRVQGTFVARCIITREGETEDCCVVQSLEEGGAAIRAQAEERYQPAVWRHMDAFILSALDEQRYTPITWRGQPLDVDYTFTVKLSRDRP